MAEKKVQMSQDVELWPGVVLTPGYEVAPRPEPGPSFGDRRIIVHEDGLARAREQTRFFTEEVADHPIASTYEGAHRAHADAARDDDGAARAREHAKASGAKA